MGHIDPLLVIKVNFGGSLRRIILDPDEKGDLGVNMDGLRARILSLFKLDTNVDLTLTYIDEDNDSITLVDEDDLYDALQQPLNPLRITTNLNSCSSNSALKVPQFQQHKTMSDIKLWLTKFLESILPKPLNDILDKLAKSLISTAIFSVPAFTVLVECLSKLALTPMSPISQCQANASFNTQSSNSDIDIDVKVKQDLETSKDTNSTPEVLPSDEFIVLALENNQRGLENENTNKGVETMFPSNIAPFNPDLILPEVVEENENTNKNVEILFPSNIAPFNPKLILLPKAVEDIWGTDNDFPKLKKPSITFTDYNYWKKTKESLGTFADCDCNIDDILAGNYSTSMFADSDGSDVISVRNHVTTDCKDEIESHLGIQCDRSKACSIIGPQLKLNYDHNQLQRSLGRLNQTDYELKPCTNKLDSLFIQDIQLVDGTLMEPAPSFTKIWRMCNNGTIVWPQEMQLMWIGGYQLTEKTSAEIQVPGDGLQVDDELDIAVKFTAPDQPGRYTSYWRMALPSGQKFVQAIWVDIQVDTSPNDHFTDRFDQEESEEKENVDVQVQSLDDSLDKSGLNQHFDDQSRNKQKLHSSSITKEVAVPGNFNITTGLAKQIVHGQRSHNQKLHSCLSTNVSKSVEQDKASKVSKLNQSKQTRKEKVQRV